LSAWISSSQVFPRNAFILSGRLIVIQADPFLTSYKTSSYFMLTAALHSGVDFKTVSDSFCRNGMVLALDMRTAREVCRIQYCIVVLEYHNSCSDYVRGW
jgi:hypothetical protein